ncbi:MAG: hypothetical protein ABL995_04195 [Bryobacteraceae bacterium]
MDLIGSLFQELITLAGYILVFAGVHKLYQIATDIREIKEAVNRARSQSSFAVPATPGKSAPTVTARPDADGSFDAANSYAESLLRAVQAHGESVHPSTESADSRS